MSYIENPEEVYTAIINQSSKSHNRINLIINLIAGLYDYILSTTTNDAQRRIILSALNQILLTDDKGMLT